MTARSLSWLVVLAAACASEPSTGGTTPPPPPPGGPASVSVVLLTPAAPSLTVGDTLRLTVVLRDSANNTLTGRTVTWSSTNAAVASVSGGLVTALVAGTTIVIATSENRADSATVTVNAGPQVTSCANPGAGWIWCDDFDVNRLSQYFEYDSANGDFTRVAAVGRNGTVGMRARWSTAEVSAGSLHLAMGKTPLAYFDPVDAGTALYRDIYWRVWVRHQPGWQGSGPAKLSRAFSFAATSWAQAMIAHVWSGQGLPNSNYLYLDPVSGTDVAGTVQTTQYNDFANFRWLGAQPSTLDMFANSRAGTWFCVEARAKLNDAGQSNGVFELWINGNAEAQRTGLNWLGSFNTYAINAVYLENYWNDGSPQAQERYMDDFVVSTQRIGC